MYQGGSAIGLVWGAAVVYFGGWQRSSSAIPFSLVLYSCFGSLFPKFLLSEGKDKVPVIVCAQTTC
jgi:hypothetical protein